MNRRSSKVRFYAVARGRTTGVFTEWPLAKTSTDGFAGCLHASFATLADAQQFLLAHGLDANGQTNVVAQKIDAAVVDTVVVSSPTRLSASSTPDPRKRLNFEAEIEDGDVRNKKSRSVVADDAANADNSVNKQRVVVDEVDVNVDDSYDDDDDDGTSSTEVDSDAFGVPLVAHQVPPAKVEAPPPPPPPVAAVAAAPEPPLSDDQQRVLDLVMAGQNVFFTGSGGCGKSFLLGRIVNGLVRKFGTPRAVAVTASTGAAAINIRGNTVHAFAGIGIGTDTAQKLAEKVYGWREKRTRWCECHVLILDEVSMISADLLEKIEFVARFVRARVAKQPVDKMPLFGGIQVCFSGDFLQLPPVNKDGRVVYAFESPLWPKIVQQTCVLKTCFRQQDESFVRVLNQLRRGVYTAEARQMLASRVNADVRKPVRLFARRAEVDRENEQALQKLRSTPHSFVAVDSAFGETANEQLTLQNRLADSCLAPSELVLKAGAQVLLIRNLDITAGLCNGSQGIVTGWTVVPPAPKSERGPANHIDPTVEYPIVLFRNGLSRVVTPEVWSLEDAGKVLASRQQVPLMLCYALTVHKCQGMTLDAAVADVSQSFATGQAYVALSRVRSLEGLSITRLPLSFQADPRVVAYYESIGDKLEDDTK